MGTWDTKGIDRRTLIKQGAAAFAGTLIIPKVGLLAASERINLGIIGVGAKGRGDMRRFLENRQCQVVAVSDVDEWRLTDARKQVDVANASWQKSGTFKGCAAYKDFRELLARPDIDAVYIATGDRWHAVMSVMAAKAGKDVYCEKPVSLTIHEGRVISDTIRRHNRVFQGGQQQRSIGDFQSAVRLIQDGRIGTLKTIYCYWVGTSNVVNLPAQPTPPTLDWEMWVGPAPYHPFNSRFHPLGMPGGTVPWDFNRDFAGGSITSNGVHHLDIAQWAIGADHTGPVEVIPPTPERRLIDYKYANGVLVQSFPGGQLNPKFQEIPEGFDPATRMGQWQILFVGDRGWLMPGRDTPFKAYPAALMDEYMVSKLGSAYKPAPPVRDAVTGATPPTALAEEMYQARGYNHHDNWLAAIRLRTDSLSNVESATRSANVAHVANIATWLGRPVKWDPIKEAFIGDDAANKLRQRPMRAPWTI
jgi:predicted dehydrogenase